MTTVYTLNLGYSPGGMPVHPVDEVGTYGSPDAAKGAAEADAGRGLPWLWIEERKVWPAEVGYERAAEIHTDTVLEGIGLAVDLMR